MTREDFAETFPQSWPTDWASQDEFMANLKQGPLSFWGISGPLSLLGIVRSLQRPRYATIYTGNREAAGFLWAEGYTLPDGLDSAECEPEGNGWTGWAQIGALVRLQMLPRSAVDIIQREDDAAIDFLPVLPPAGTDPAATPLLTATSSAGLDRTGSVADPPEGAANPAGGSVASGNKARPPGDPATRAVAAAYALQKAGKPVSIRAACKAAGVDRNNLAEKYPEAIGIIEKLAEVDRTPQRGVIERRTGTLDAWDDPEDD